MCGSIRPLKSKLYTYEKHPKKSVTAEQRIYRGWLPDEKILIPQTELIAGGSCRRPEHFRRNITAPYNVL
jgi:hypothetical protein